MTLADLIKLFRRRADDRAQTGNLWTDEDITDFANHAEGEAAERSLCLRDHATARLCQVALVAGQQEYLLDPRVIDLTSVRLRGVPGTLCIGDTDDHLANPHAAGKPEAYALYQRGKGVAMVLDRPAPDPALMPTDYQPFLDLAVYRRPLAPLSVDTPDQCPEIPEPQHKDLVYGMLAYAYSTRDVDAGNDRRALDNEALFTQAFGAKIDWNVRRKQLRRRPTVVRPLRW